MNKDQIIEAIKAMSVLELNELVKACEEEFGVSAAAPVAVAGAAGAAEGGAAEQTEFTSRLSWKLSALLSKLNSLTGNLNFQKALHRQCLFSFYSALSRIFGGVLSSFLFRGAVADGMCFCVKGMKYTKYSFFGK